MVEIEHGSCRKIWTAITFDSGVCVRPMIYPNARKINNKSSRQIQLVSTFHLDVQFRRKIYRDVRNWTRKPMANSIGHNFWLGCMFEAQDISRRSKMNSRSSRHIQMVITFQSDVGFRRIIYRALEIEYGSSPEIWTTQTFDSGVCVRPVIYRDAQKMNNKSSLVIQLVIIFHIGCPIQEHNISRRLKLNTEALCKFKRPKLLTRVYAWSPLYIETLEMNNESYREIQMVNTFHSLVQFWHIIYRYGRSWTWKPLTNSIGHNFWLEFMCEAQDISKSSKMNRRSSRDIQMVITFQSDVRFRRIIYRDTKNWIRKHSGNLNNQNFWLGCMCEARDISRRSKNEQQKLSSNSNGHKFSYRMSDSGA